MWESEDVGHRLALSADGEVMAAAELAEIKGLRLASHTPHPPLPPREGADSRVHAEFEDCAWLVSSLLNCPINQPSGFHQVLIFSRIQFLSLQKEGIMCFSNGQYSVSCKGSISN